MPFDAFHEKLQDVSTLHGVGMFFKLKPEYTFLKGLSEHTNPSFSPAVGYTPEYDMGTYVCCTCLSMDDWDILCLTGLLEGVEPIIYTVPIFENITTSTGRVFRIDLNSDNEYADLVDSSLLIDDTSYSKLDIWAETIRQNGVLFKHSTSDLTLITVRTAQALITKE